MIIALSFEFSDLNFENSITFCFATQTQAKPYEFIAKLPFACKQRRRTLQQTVIYFINVLCAMTPRQ
jgi:hypothetical protein